MDKGFYSWDIIVEKYDDNMMFFDLRSDTDYLQLGEKKQNNLELQFVGETSTTNPPPASKDEYDRELKKNTSIDDATKNNLAYPLMVEGALTHHEIQQSAID